MMWCDHKFYYNMHMPRPSPGTNVAVDRHVQHGNCFHACSVLQHRTFDSLQLLWCHSRPQFKSTVLVSHYPQTVIRTASNWGLCATGLARSAHLTHPHSNCSREDPRTEEGSMTRLLIVFDLQNLRKMRSWSTKECQFYCWPHKAITAHQFGLWHKPNKQVVKSQRW